MILADVNVLVYAHRKDATDHALYRAWFESVLNSDSAFGLCDLAMSGFLRIVTHPRIFKSPSKLSDALAFCRQIRDQPNCIVVAPGAQHWSIFERLCTEAQTRGNLIPDAWLAAIAIEHGCEWITTDRDFGRFNGLKWRHPLAG